MKYVPPLDGTAPNADAERADASDVPSAVSDECVTGKLAKYLDLLDSEMAEHWAQTSAA